MSEYAVPLCEECDVPFTASSRFSTERRHFVKQIISDKVTKVVVLALELLSCSSVRWVVSLNLFPVNRRTESRLTKWPQHKCSPGQNENIK